MLRVFILTGRILSGARHDLLQQGLLRAVLGGAGAAESSSEVQRGSQVQPELGTGSTTALGKVEEGREPWQAAGQEAEDSEVRGHGEGVGCLLEVSVPGRG